MADINVFFSQIQDHGRAGLWRVGIWSDFHAQFIGEINPTQIGHTHFINSEESFYQQIDKSKNTLREKMANKIESIVKQVNFSNEVEEQIINFLINNLNTLDSDVNKMKVVLLKNQTNKIQFPVNDKNPAEVAVLSSKPFIQEAVLVELRNQFKDMSQIFELNQKIQWLEADLLDTENHLMQIRNGNMAITSSITWRVARIIHRIIDTILTPDTREAFLAKLVKRNSAPVSTKKEA